MARLDFQYFDGINSLVASNVAKRAELFHAENVRSPMIGTIEKRAGMLDVGTGPALANFVSTANQGLFFFASSGATLTGMYRVSTVSGITSVYYLKNDGVWTALTGKGTSLTASIFDTTIAGNNILLTNYSDNNKYIKGSDGVTVVDSTDSTGHLFNSPKASICNYYKNRIYLGDYLQGSTRYKTGIVRSSFPCGIVSLVNNDPLAPWTSIEVTDVKYIYTTAPGNTLDVYRGNTKIAVVTVTSITSNTINCTTAFESGQNIILSADELWAPGSFSGEKQFRWSYNPSATGISVKEYDTFKLPGQDNEEIKLMSNVSNMMVISNNSSTAIWNDYVLQSFDSGVGCVSKNGWVKLLGVIYFTHYSGIFSTAGGAPQLISSKVEQYFQGATKSGLEACAAGKKDKSIFFAIGDVTLKNPDGSISRQMTDVCLEYSITQENWFVHTGVKASQFATYIEASNPDKCLFLSKDTSFPVTEFLTDITDNGKEIPFRADTSNICLNAAFENISYPTDIILEAQRGSQIKCFISLDMGVFYEVEGEAGKGCTIFKCTSENGDKSQPVRCRNIRISLRDFSKQICTISKMSIIYNPTTESEPQRLDYQQ